MARVRSRKAMSRKVEKIESIDITNLFDYGSTVKVADVVNTLTKYMEVYGADSTMSCSCVTTYCT